MSSTPTWQHRALDVGERTVVTALEALAAVYLAKGQVSVSAAEAAALAGIAAGLALLRSFLAAWRPRPGNIGWLEDLVLRATFTFAQTLVACLITAVVTPLDLSSLKAAGVAGLAAAVAAVKAAVAQGVGNPASAGLVPASATTTPSTAAPSTTATPPTPPVQGPGSLAGATTSGAAGTALPAQRGTEEQLGHQAVASAVVTELGRRLSGPIALTQPEQAANRTTQGS